MFDILTYLAALVVGGVAVGIYYHKSKGAKVRAILDKATDTRESLQRAVAEIRSIW